MKNNGSSALFQRAQNVIPGGVNSPVRAFKAVGGTPPFIAAGKGSRITDVDRNEYIDYVSSYGPLLFGHAPEFFVKAIQDAAIRGTCFGGPTALEVQLAEIITELVPSMDMVRLVNSGTEATASAIRLARGFTGRSRIIKCAGCYHGSVDSLLVTAGSGVATLGIPETAGVPQALAAETIVIEYNDSIALLEVFEKYGNEVAAFILEPVAGNMGLVLPEPGYLHSVIEITHKHGALVIFDEVISGFRAAAGGAQALYGVRPDITCLGKILGGGVPIGAYGGRKDIMNSLAPAGHVYQAGTLSGNPIATTAGIGMLTEIKKQGSGLYEKLDDLGARLENGLHVICQEFGLQVQIHRLGSLMTLFFADHTIRNYQDARSSNTEQFKRFFHALLDGGIYIPPSQFECMFISLAHSEAEIDETLTVMRRALQAAAA